MCSCAGIGQDILLLSQLIETKSPSPKKKPNIQDPKKDQHHPSIQRKTSIIQASEEKPKKDLISLNRQIVLKSIITLSNS